MESATILTPPSTGLCGILHFVYYSNILLNIPEGPEYEKISIYVTFIDARGEVLPTPHRNNDSCCDL